MKQSLRWTLMAGVVVVSPSISSAFSISQRSAVISRRSISAHVMKARTDGDDESNGMEEAFRQLDGLKSLSDDEFTLPSKDKLQDPAFAEAMQNLDLSEIQSQMPEATTESEVALYKDMVSEVSDKTEIDLIADLKSDMGGDPTVFPSFDPAERNTEKFMEKALDEALDEAEKTAEGEVQKDAILDNREIMKEIEAIFDKANSELLDGLQEIREEQLALAKESAERNAQLSQSKITEDQERLAMAEDNMKRMLAKVNEETKNVELAIEDLKKAQAEMDGGVDDQLNSLKAGGIVKQATLVGTLLFSLRSITEAVLLLAGDSSHLLPALVQGAIAIIFFAAFIFL